MVTKREKAILRRALLLEELQDFLERKEGRIWTENDSKLTESLVCEIQALENVPN